MISTQTLRKSLATLIFTFLLITCVVFGFNSTSAWAENLSATFVPQPQFAVANRIQAVAKGLEGKTQEAFGDITNDPKNQVMGQTKQVEGQMLNIAEDIKDQVPSADRVTAVMKDFEGKAQEATGSITGDIQDQVVGRAKQVEGNSRGLIEDFRDNIKGIFD